MFTGSDNADPKLRPRNVLLVHRNLREQKYGKTVRSAKFWAYRVLTRQAGFLAAAEKLALHAVTTAYVTTINVEMQVMFPLDQEVKLLVEKIIKFA